MVRILMNNFLKEFKTFAMKGNVMDMSIGIIIGAAFGKIVTSLVNDILMPPLGMLINNVSFSELSYTLQEAQIDLETNEVLMAAVTLNWGQFVQTIVDFIIIAFSIFFIITMINKFNRQQQKKEDKKASEEVELLAEIRDLLKSQK